ncbi:hypothetical protein DWC20_08760 [Clostridium botulinum]|uniref:hypothetical protein n=1 Tax=Clostridium botulinum TaxID=1491 RepID=UPI00035F9D7E|nr:hypothetical protein [Clostridium botulinum]MBN1035634.1 hypothetical protein [Clostridium botulinum]
MKSINYEDMIMKRAMDVFAEDGLKFFGIEKKVKEVSSTEIVVLEAKNMFMDYTFLMEDDTYIHIEFQTTNKGINDLRRFKAYEALLELQMNKDVVTYVVYSGNIKNPLNSYTSGINTYNVRAISMANKDGDMIFKDIVDKIKNGDKIEKQDLIALTFTPIMGGELNKSDKILNAIKIVKNIDSEYRYDMESMLYAFASKFLKGSDLEKVKEELKMTELGKIIKDEGKKEKAIETAKVAITKGMDNETIRDLTGLTIEEIDLIRQVLN